MLDAIEQAVTLPDDRTEVMKMCLTTNTGDYQPVEVPQVQQPPTSDPRSTTRGRPVVARPHIPGRAGGGWEEDSEDEAERQLKEISELSIQSSSGADERCRTFPVLHI